MRDTLASLAFLALFDAGKPLQPQIRHTRFARVSRALRCGQAPTTPNKAHSLRSRFSRSSKADTPTRQATPKAECDSLYTTTFISGAGVPL